MQFINVLNKNISDFLSSKGIKYIRKDSIDGRDVYVYVYTTKTLGFLNEKFSVKDYFLGNRMNL